jgi:hypothetical protein
MYKKLQRYIDPDTTRDAINVMILVKCECLGGVSEMFLLPLQEGVTGVYIVITYSQYNYLPA